MQEVRSRQIILPFHILHGKTLVWTNLASDESAAQEQERRKLPSGLGGLSQGLRLAKRLELTSSQLQVFRGFLGFFRFRCAFFDCRIAWSRWLLLSLATAWGFSTSFR